MKHILIVALATTVALFSLPTSLTAQDPLPKPAATEADSEIIPPMERIASAFRRVRRLASSPANNAETLTFLETIRTEALASRKHMPMMAADLPEAERPKFLKAYQARMDEFIGILDKVSAAIKAGDNATAASLVLGLPDFQKQAHADFKKESE